MKKEIRKYRQEHQAKIIEQLINKICAMGALRSQLTDVIVQNKNAFEKFNSTWYTSSIPVAENAKHILNVGSEEIATGNDKIW